MSRRSYRVIVEPWGASVVRDRMTQRNVFAVWPAPGGLRWHGMTADHVLAAACADALRVAARELARRQAYEEGAKP